MHQSQVTPSATSRHAQPKLGAWAIRKPSTNRISPFNKKEISQLLKATNGSSTVRQHVSKFAVVPSSTEEEDHEGYPLRRKSSKILNMIKLIVKLNSTIQKRLERHSNLFTAKVKELQPTIRSLSMAQAQATPKLRNTRALSQNFKTSFSSRLDTPKILEKQSLRVGLNTPSNIEEKLITVGGYIISLQETNNENITSVIRPRVSSDRNGLELEVKILGCNPVDIKFEKRYDTLIVIGVNKNSLRKSEDEPKDTLAVKDTHVKMEKESSMFKNMKGFSQDFLSGVYPSNIEHLDEILEIINIFVPKHAALNQIFISKPDSKGRIFVKGP